MTPPRPLWRAAAMLGGFALFGLGLVALVHDRTQPRIAANQRAVWRATLDALLPAGSYDNDLLADSVTVGDPGLARDRPVTVHRARQHGRPVAAVLSPVAPDGYNGAIRLLVAIRADGTLLGVRVLEHRETPGLGDAIEPDQTDWLRGFDGRSLENPPAERWTVRRDGGDFDQFAGATVTPRAVVKAVHRTLAFYRSHGASLFEAPTGASLSPMSTDPREPR